MIQRASPTDFHNGLVWAFDLGKGSIGEAVRSGNEFLHKASLLIPADFAETKTAAIRRRMWRTRQAHDAREKWLEQFWEAAGLTVLRGRQLARVDENGSPIPRSEWKRNKGKWQTLPETPEQEANRERLEREFAEAGDTTCYTSCLLRIKLLRGDTDLKDWQIFKALRSAIQKRGYGKIPWAEKEARRAGKSLEEMEKEEQKKDPSYVAALNKWREFKAKMPSEFHFPCYYDVWKMGLWNPHKAKSIEPRMTHDAESTRNVRFDRDDVEREIKTLANNAANQLPILAQAFARIQREGWDQADADSGHTKHFPVRAESFGDFLCHGPAGAAYASFSPKLRDDVGLHLGSNDDWMGALGQKIPRFDNRILDDCVLIPRYHVCKADIRKNEKTALPFPETLLSAEATFLMKLKNILVADGIDQRKLNVTEVQNIFATVSADVSKVKPDAKDWPRKIANCFALTKSDWGRTKGIKELKLRPLTGHEEVKPPKDSGRSGFSRPALRLLKELVLSGKSPRDFRAEQLAKLNGSGDPTKGLVAADLKFLLDMGETWKDVHIPTQKLDALAARHTEDGRLDADKAIADMLGSVNDPVVRHRLGVFADRVRELRKKFGMPEEVVLEFIREDFMGPKRKMELLQFQRDREKARSDARTMAKEAGAEEKSAALKYELCKTQGCICLYCGQAFAATKLDEYEIEHIVPRSQNGPDAMVNYVLAHRECNEAKGEQTPFQWKHGKEGWDGYKQIVERHATALRNKKVQLLVREDAPELVTRYTALAETAWISKLAQTIVSLFFGWNNGNDPEGHKRVAIISGGLTARVRRKYRLNSILNPCPANEDPLLWEEKCEKNRSDDRHHALDAMVISFIPGWARDERKEHFFRFPEPIHQNAKGFFEREINQVMPRAIAFEKAALAETIYGARVDGGKRVIVQRVPLVKLAFAVRKQKDVFDLEYAAKQADSIRNPVVQTAVKKFLATNPNQNAWTEFCRAYRVPRADGSDGPRVERVTVFVGQADQFKDLSKDGKGAWRKRKKDHQGQIVVAEASGRFRVLPVYVFESPWQKSQALRKGLAAGDRVFGFFQSGCLVDVDREVEHRSKPLPSGTYKLRTIREDGYVQVEDQSGRTYPFWPLYGLAKLVAAGFRRKETQRTPKTTEPSRV